ncbi:hypothetical protein AAIQ03_004654 [Raoultella ornithinolytica]|nr:hypothetical protein [Raoultella ornithinolytica]EKV0508856.1 hypothetical protein [Raoultella ornithinolytica]EKY4179243.1 hypothetical protein [Raoultella ornithinolytica]EMF1903586.1 hypothetical protein [Raoultella ornithinolytica]
MSLPLTLRHGMETRCPGETGGAGQRRRSWLCAEHDSPPGRPPQKRERQELKCFSFLYSATLYQAELRKAKTLITTLNSSPGPFPFSIIVMMMPATTTTFIRTKATARVAPIMRVQAETGYTKD